MLEEVSGPRRIAKRLEYAMVVTIVDYDPGKFGPAAPAEDKIRPRVVIVDGTLAIRLKGRLYTKL